MSQVTTKLEDKDVYVYDGQIYIPNKYTAGTVGSKVLVNIRDKKKLLGMRCPECNRVYFPARKTCGECFALMDDYVEVSDRGTVMSYTMCNTSTIVQPVDTPIYAIIQLDGSDTGFVHMLGGVEPEKISIGMRVQAVFKEKEDRRGSMLDIRYFKPL